MDNDGGGAGLLWMIHGDGPYFIENYRFSSILVIDQKGETPVHEIDRFR